MNFGSGKLFGLEATVGFKKNTVVALYFCSDGAQIMRDFGLTPLDSNDSQAALIFKDIEDGKSIPIEFVNASEFEKQVWSALLCVEAGVTTSYSDIAQQIGRPTAVRAVASAIGRNPISYIVPCHRILRRNGALGGYRWGVDVKRSLLARESRT